MGSLIPKNQTISSREIAELTQKRHDNVRTDIEKLNESYVKLGLLKIQETPYIESQNKQTYNEYLLTKIQTLDLMTGYNAELRIKVNRRWEELEAKQPRSTLDVFDLALKSLREQEADIAEIKSEVKELKAISQTRPEYFTIVGYAKINHVKLNNTMAQSLGIKASNMCKQAKYPIDKVTDGRFGKVNLYPKAVLDKVFRIYNLI